MEVFNVDVPLFFAETLSKGKKNDHAMHHVSLDAIIKHYQEIFPGVTADALKHIKVWTDNAPHQYRSHQNFTKVLTVIVCRWGITMTHPLAVVDNFKGIPDTMGKDPAHFIRGPELMGLRLRNTDQVFVHCSRYLERTEDDTLWQESARIQDRWLAQKGRCGSNALT